MTAKILGNPGFYRPLLEIALEENNSIGSRACWIVEFVYKASPELLYPHLDTFAAGLNEVRPESSIRPLAKVCELLVLAYYGSGSNLTKPPLSILHKQLLTEACFDWLIGPQKIAPKAYSMQTLYLLGKEISWVHGELREVLQQHYSTGSPGYQSRARKILDKLP